MTLGTRRRLPPGARWVTLPSGAKRVELVVDVGVDPATGKRRQTRRRYKTVDESIEAYGKIRQQAREGTYVSRSPVTVDQACADWLASKHGVRRTTLAGYRDALKPVRKAYGALPVQRLTKRHLDDLIPLLRAGALPRGDERPRRPWKPRTVNLMLFVLGQVLDDALRQGLVSRNVAELVDRLPQTKTEMATYTRSEVRKVLTAARDDRLEHAWHLALYGLRRGEICGLSWSDIDLKARTLAISANRVSVDGNAIDSEPKTEAGRRVLPLSDSLVRVLRRAKRRQAAERLAAGRAYHEGAYLVVDEVGRRLHPDTLTDRWDQLVERAAVRRIRLHDARHTAGTLMHLDGVPIAVIAAWLGHASSSFTQRTYLHSQPDALRAAAESLGIVTRT